MGWIIVGVKIRDIWVEEEILSCWKYDRFVVIIRGNRLVEELLSLLCLRHGDLLLLLWLH